MVTVGPLPGSLPRRHTDRVRIGKVERLRRALGFAAVARRYGQPCTGQHERRMNPHRADAGARCPEPIAGHCSWSSTARAQIHPRPHELVPPRNLTRLACTRGVKDDGREKRGEHRGFPKQSAEILRADVLDETFRNVVHVFSPAPRKSQVPTHRAPLPDARSCRYENANVRQQVVPPATNTIIFRRLNIGTDVNRALTKIPRNASLGGYPAMGTHAGKVPAAPERHPASPFDGYQCAGRAGPQ